MQVRSLGWEDPMEEGMATRSSILAWRIPGKAEPKEKKNTLKYSSYLNSNWRRKWQPIPVLLPGKFHGWRTLVGYSVWGREESDMTEQLHY